MAEFAILRIFHDAVQCPQSWSRLSAEEAAKTLRNIIEGAKGHREWNFYAESPSRPDQTIAPQSWNCELGVSAIANELEDGNVVCLEFDYEPAEPRRHIVIEAYLVLRLDGAGRPVANRRLHQPRVVAPL